jgi:hypothetical protein
MNQTFLYFQNPEYQAIIFVLLTPIIIFILQPKTADKAWLIAAYTFAAFLLANAALSWFQEHQWRYFFYSIGCSIGYLLVIALIMAGMLRILRLKDSGESAMAFLMIIYQPFALLLVMLVSWITG